MFECVADVVFEACFLLSVLKSECGMLVFLKLARLSRWLLGLEACCVIVLWLLVLC